MSDNGSIASSQEDNSQALAALSRECQRLADRAVCNFSKNDSNGQVGKGLLQDLRELGISLDVAADYCNQYMEWIQQGRTNSPEPDRNNGSARNDAVLEAEWQTLLAKASHARPRSSTQMVPSPQLTSSSSLEVHPSPPLKLFPPRFSMLHLISKLSPPKFRLTLISRRLGSCVPLIVERMPSRGSYSLCSASPKWSLKILR